MPSSLFSKSKKHNTETSSSTFYADSLNDSATTSSTTTTTTTSNNPTKRTNSTKTKSTARNTYHSINKNLNSLFHSPFGGLSSSSSSSSSAAVGASGSSHCSPSTSAMMPSVASRLKKNIARTKEKFLQNIGKTDRTSDESFDLYVENFDRQHTQASKLTKELNKYMNCLRETQKSSRAFYDTLCETYEANWHGANEFAEQIQHVEHKWNDYVTKLINDVQQPLIAYLNEFPELKKKIEKRDNRLLDYDNARHNLEAAQLKTSKKQNSASILSSPSVQQQQTSTTSTAQQSSLTTSAGSSSTSSSITDQLTKLTKLKIDLEDKQQNYDELNQTLCMSLPVLYENRIKFYSSLFQTFFHTETIFHSECVEAKSRLDYLCESLSTKTAEQTPNPQRLFEQKQEQLRLLHKQKEYEEQQQQQQQLKDNDETVNDNYYDNNTTLDKQRSSSTNDADSDKSLSRLQSSDGSTKPSMSEFVPNACELSANSSYERSKSLSEEETTAATTDKDKSSCNTPPKMSKEILKNKCLYKVRATYPYEAKELDELSFLKDDLIDVVEGSESEKEELDDGWLIGVHEVTLKRGLFPENFTRRIS